MRRVLCRLPGAYACDDRPNSEPRLLSFYPHERGTVKGKNKQMIALLPKFKIVRSFPKTSVLGKPRKTARIFLTGVYNDETNSSLFLYIAFAGGSFARRRAEGRGSVERKNKCGGHYFPFLRFCP
jgi:hypothetical protein